MKITFLVGNGFDISAGVDTSYESFYKWYYLQPSLTSSILKFKEEIINDVESSGKNWADFETGLGKYTAHFSSKNVDTFLECYEDAVESIATYLEQVKNQFDTERLTEDDFLYLIDGIQNFYKELNPQERGTFSDIFESDIANNIIISFVSFNYTDILDRCIDIIANKPLKEWEYGGRKRYTKINPKVLHIHGTSNEYPILGVSDETQVDNQELLATPHFASTMIKSQSVDSIGQPWYAQADDIIEDSRIICVLGMSLGLSDSKWWNRINKWLRAGEWRHLILFWYTKTPPSRRSVFQYNKQTAAVKDLMLGYSNFNPDEVAKIKDQIHVVFNTDKVLRISPSPASAKEEALV